MIMDLSKLRLFLVILLLSVFFVSCKKDDKDNNYVPYVPVNISIYLNDPQYSALSAVGNHVMLSNCGYSGIIVYRYSSDEFVALDRTCTYELSHDCKVEGDASGFFLDCPCCNTRYAISDGNLVLDDTAHVGPADHPLKLYNTSFNESSSMLYIYN